jgi:peptidoglycan/LPS O-acetylase OafA/YrhL
VRNKIIFANALRGIAALCVLVWHYWIVFWNVPEASSKFIGAPISILSDRPHLGTAFTLGGFGVALFFLVSGFVIPFSIKGRKTTEFIVERVFRIWPTYLAGFAITVLAIYLTSKWYGLKFPYSARQVAIHSVPGLRDAASSAKIDYVVWTLEAEIKFYVLCALFAGSIRTGSPRVFLAPLACFALTLATVRINHANHLYLNSLPFLVFMFIGVALHYFYVGNLRWVATAAIILALLVASYVGRFAIGRTPHDLSYVAAVFIFVLAMWSGDHLAIRPLAFLADISYPLYVSHGIAGYAFMSMLFGCGVPAIACIVVTGSVAIFAAWLIHVFIENRFRLRRDPYLGSLHTKAAHLL